MDHAGEALLRHIKEAFQSRPYPGDNRIVLDHDGHNLEAIEVRDALKGQHWRDVSVDTIRSLSAPLAFLSPAGFAFYLPAFMILSVTDFERTNTLAHDLVWSLTLPTGDETALMRSFAANNPNSGLSSEDWQQVFAVLGSLHRDNVYRQLFLDRMSQLNADERGAVRSYLEYMRDVRGEEFPNHAPAIALESYWATA